MSTLLPYPRFKAIDANGIPYSGGKVYTFRAGTSTAKATYSDVACATPNANPVVLDSAGEATLYLKGKYKIVLKTSADVTVWTLDNVQGMGDWEESAFYPDYNETDQGAAGSGASMKDLIDWIGSENATLILAHNSGSTITTYTLSTSETIPSNISLKVQKGAKITIDAGKTLTINGNIEARDWEIFTGLGTVAGSPLNAIMLSAWFNAGLTNSTTPSGAIKSIVASGAQGDIYYHNGTTVVRLGAGTTQQFLKTQGVAANPVWATTPSIRDRSRNLIITNNASHADHQVDVDADEIILQDTDGIPLRVTSVNLTVDIAVSGLNGLDTGTESSTAWYYIWVISNGTTVAGLLSASGTAPTMPSGYTYKAFVGAVHNLAGNFRNFDQLADTYLYNAVIQVVVGTGSTTTATIDISACVPAVGVKGVFGKTGGNTGALNWFADYETFTDTQVGDNSAVPVQLAMAAAGNCFSWYLPFLKTAQTMYHQVSANDVDVWITGFTWR